jgi:hypothetical protein
LLVKGKNFMYVSNMGIHGKIKQNRGAIDVFAERVSIPAIYRMHTPCRGI